MTGDRPYDAALSIEEAASALRPSAEAVAAAWRRLVIAEREQVEALPGRPGHEDFYRPVAQGFRDDPSRTDDPLLDGLLSLVRPDETWFDLGAGAGRFALPIALQAARVYAVEPSPGMREAMRQSAEEHGIDNVELFAERWPGASEVPVADAGLICHVGYDIAEIAPFLDQMEAHARRLCVAVLFGPAPLSDFAPLWRQVHGEERVMLPALREFITLLFARGCVPEVKTLSLPPRTYESLEALHGAARRPLWVAEGSARDQRLGRAVAETAMRVDGRVALSTQQRTLGVVTWRPL